MLQGFVQKGASPRILELAGHTGAMQFGDAHAMSNCKQAWGHAEVVYGGLELDENDSCWEIPLDTNTAILPPNEAPTVNVMLFLNKAASRFPGPNHANAAHTQPDTAMPGTIPIIIYRVIQGVRSTSIPSQAHLLSYSVHGHNSKHNC